MCQNKLKLTKKEYRLLLEVFGIAATSGTELSLRELMGCMRWFEDNEEEIEAFKDKLEKINEARGT